MPEDQQDGARGRPTPSVLVFDVNETLLDIESIAPLFDRVFGDPAVLRVWFGELVLYSMTLTLSGLYSDFFTLGRAVLGMLAEIRGIHLSDTDEAALAAAMRGMPAHPDVVPGLQRLSELGYRLVTLTNSPTREGASSPLDNAGLSSFFERQFSVEATRVFKPATVLYRTVAADLGVPMASCMMVAAHAWDIVGAQCAGMQGALVTRPGNAPLTTSAVPQPNVLARDLPDLANQLTALDRGSATS